MSAPVRARAVDAGSWAETLEHGRVGSDLAEAVLGAIEDAGFAVVEAGSRVDSEGAAVLAREANGLLNIAASAERNGQHELATWMLTYSSTLARHAALLDPSLGGPLQVALGGPS